VLKVALGNTLRERTAAKTAAQMDCAEHKATTSRPSTLPVVAQPDKPFSAECSGTS